MPAPLLYQMFRSKSKFPLHRAIKAHREDVVFLYIVEFSSQVCISMAVIYLIENVFSISFTSFSANNC